MHSVSLLKYIPSAEYTVGLNMELLNIWLTLKATFAKKCLSFEKAKILWPTEAFFIY